MVILQYSSGDKRVELQQDAIMLPTSTWNVLNAGERQRLTNFTDKYTVIVWDGDVLKSLTPSAAWQGALNQFRTRIKIELDIDVPDYIPGKNHIVDGKVVPAS